MSDAAGLDPRIHHDRPEEIVGCVRDFLAERENPRPMGSGAIFALYQEFVAALPAIAATAQLGPEELEPLTAFNDWHHLATEWLRERTRRRSR